MEAESFSIGQLTNAGFVLEVNGRKYRFAELLTKHYGKLEDHLRRIQPRATTALAESVKAFGFTPEQIGMFMIVAYERDLTWPSPVDTVTSMQAIMTDAEARNDFVKFSLEIHQPGITSSEAREVADNLTRQQLRRVIGWGLSGKDVDAPEQKAAEQEGGPGLGEPRPA